MRYYLKITVVKGRRTSLNNLQAESLLIIMVHNEHNHVIIRERLRDVERNDEDASKPVARHFILHNHSKQHIAVCGLSLHLGSSESRKHENKNLPSSLLLIPTVSTSAFHSTNSFVFSYHHTPTNNVAPFSAYKPTHNAQFLQSLWRRANARKVCLLNLSGGQFMFSAQLLILNYHLFLHRGNVN